MSLKREIEKLLKIKKSTKFKKIHKGYAADCYILETQNEKYFIKQFLVKNDIDKLKFSAASRFKDEYTSIQNLNSVYNQNIITPTIIAISKKNNILVQKFIKGKKFYTHILKQNNFLKKSKKINKLFFELGKFFAEFHNKNKIKNNKTQLFGDICAHNMMFVGENKLFLFDPAFKNGDVHFDLAMISRIFYPYNPLIKLMLGKTKKMEINFFKGYMLNTKFNINKDEIKTELIKILKIERKIKRKGFIYRIKKTIVNILIKKLIKDIKNKKIKIYN